MSNLDFSSSKKDVVDHLHSCSAGYKEGLRSVSIPPPKDGKGASGGYCFVEYASAAHARKHSRHYARVKWVTRLGCTSKHQTCGSKHGKCYSEQEKKGVSKDTEATKISKLAVRNVAFQASEGELHALFCCFWVSEEG